MLTGENPFPGDDDQRFQEDSVLFLDVIYPESLEEIERLFVSALLEKDPVRRLGCPPQPEEAIKFHQYFDEMDWEALEKKKVPPPFIPIIEGDRDASNFDEEFTKESPNIISGGWRRAPVISKSSVVIYKERFQGFSFMNENDE